jgi:hypothetical protein
MLPATKIQPCMWPPCSLLLRVPSAVMIVHAPKTILSIGYSATKSVLSVSSLATKCSHPPYPTGQFVSAQEHSAINLRQCALLAKIKPRAQHCCSALTGEFHAAAHTLQNISPFIIAPCWLRSTQKAAKKAASHCRATQSMPKHATMHHVCIQEASPRVYPALAYHVCGTQGTT